ncbi:MAG TPA: acetoacetate--CoA ligase [Baekduia sp.]|nr:acetoacetate--CoA ligase [Baekduia sp.]
MSDTIPAGGEILWRPTPESIAETRIARYLGWLEQERGLTFDDYWALHRWSVEHLEDFWQSIWDFFDVRAETPPEEVLSSRTMPGARWFPGSTLNFAERLLRNDFTDEPAMIFVREGEEPVETSWSTLREQVAAVAAGLTRLGVERGDRVAAYMPNVPETVVAFLGCASVGAIWTACAPDFGTRSVVERFAQLEPKVLIAADGYAFNGKRRDRREVVAELQRSLPSVEHTVLVRTAFPDDEPDEALGAVDWRDLLEGDADAGTAPVAVPFEHPLWVLYSSGTTGTPKGIVHGHGGMLLEQLKSGLCLDLRPGDRFLFYTSTAWVVWNMHVSSLLAGVAIVLYDGSPAFPDPMGTFRVAAQTQATIVGVGAAYVTGVRKTGVLPSQEVDLSSVRHLITTGSPLPPADWRWVQDAVNPDVRLDSACGGTDVGTAFIGGSPMLPVEVGEIPGPWLGCAVEAWSPEGEPVIGELGELVVTEPMPSMPVFFWNDPDGERYHESYFSTYPGVWRHGDWIRISDHGTLIVAGRSDSTLNRLGVRMGSADIYAVVEQMEEVADSIVLGVELEDGGYWMPLFVVPAEGHELDDDLRAKINGAIADGLSRRHVPDEVIAAPAVPRTLTGKKLEVPLKRLVQGETLERVVNLGAVDKPDALEWYAEFAARRREEAGASTG